MTQMRLSIVVVVVVMVTGATCLPPRPQPIVGTARAQAGVGAGGAVPRSLACGDLTNTSCGACHGSGIVDGCDWCEATRDCKSKSSVYVSCPDVWTRDPDDCSLLDAPPPCSLYGTGCTNLNAWNYNFRATTDDSSCLYQADQDPMQANDTGCSKECVCEKGGFFQQYGKFCGDHYYGCLGAQPCDALDICCQMHDWCVTVEPALDCECGYLLHTCVTSLTEADFEQSFCPEYVRESAKKIAEEIWFQVVFECLNKDFYAKCGPEFNCNNVGNCLFTGGCDCGGTQDQHFAYDEFGRTNCECEAGWYPLCGETADSICNVYCDPTITCNDGGTCDSEGHCVPL
ncbi:hypothetical protein Pelo_6895 [Pelomyxa schiedti]|nr:hypothetical protein Pelo_6895 [Pelomyxa schiedti]